MQAYNGPWLTEADTLAKILAPYGDEVRIVIASLWAKRLELDELRALMPHELQQKILDAIWTPRDDPTLTPQGKFDAIQAWLERAELTQDWLALDDDARGWPPEFENRLVVADGTLANVLVQQQLVRSLSVLASLSPPLHRC